MSNFIVRLGQYNINNMDKKEEKPLDTAQGKQKINIENLQKDLEDCKTKCEEYLNGWKRERADFLNYKKDEMERIGQLAKYANTEIIFKIIPILDNIYLAEAHVPEELLNEGPSASSGQTSATAKVWIQGFLQIKNQLVEFLKKEGIEPIEVIGKEFDPNLMESVGEVDCLKPDVKQKETGIVVEEVQRGYTLHGKIIRPARVKITK